jgi:H/ACA ribonucleoprotein complex subunit 3
MKVQIDGRTHSLDTQNIIDSGGEADIYRLGNNRVLKLFKQPDHPDHAGQPEQKQAARKRLAEHQKKLPQFPEQVPNALVTPQSLARDDGGAIVGYSMQRVTGVELLVRYADKTFRSSIDENAVVSVFSALRNVVKELHESGIVIGDFSDLNVFVKGTAPRLIDVDSYQFANFLCRTFTQRFADPTKLTTSNRSNGIQNPTGGLTLAEPHDAMSDWYAFCVLLLQSLLFAGPYSGIHRPENGDDQLSRSERILSRVTIFDSAVQYPKPARTPDVLPPDLLDFFSEVFTEDRREPFPERLLAGINWQTCSSCGLVHARSQCPECSDGGGDQTVERVTNDVSATRVFRTSGRIMFADCQNDKLQWLDHKGGRFFREDDTPIADATVRPLTRYRLYGDTTIFGVDGMMHLVGKDRSKNRLSVDSFGRQPVFDVTGDKLFWVRNGDLKRAGKFGVDYAESVGSVLKDRTLFWVGDKHGFGFYRAGKIQQYFVFDTAYRGINENVTVPPITGQLINATASICRDRIWFFQTVNEQGRRHNRCYLIGGDGTVQAKAQTTAGDGSWLGKITGTLAAGNFLLAATDDGVVRIEPNGNRLAPAKRFSDTDHIVDSTTHLLPGNGGLTAVNRRSIWNLTISSQ